jgi:magnesium-transporting ATPase (P-type)
MHCCFAKLGVHVFRGEAFEQKAAQALRVLGTAYCERRGACYDAAEATGDIDRLTWTGLVGLADPVRQGLPALMHKLHCAGIQTIMLTGDQSATARAVAERIGLSPGVPDSRLERSDIVFERSAPILPRLLRPVQHLLIRAAVDLTPSWLRTILRLNGYGLHAWEAEVVRQAGALANRLVLESNPAVQACRRMRLPVDYLYINHNPAVGTLSFQQVT